MDADNLVLFDILNLHLRHLGGEPIHETCRPPEPYYAAIGWMRQEMIKRVITEGILDAMIKSGMVKKA